MKSSKHVETCFVRANNDFDAKLNAFWMKKKILDKNPQKRTLWTGLKRLIFGLSMARKSWIEKKFTMDMEGYGRAWKETEVSQIVWHSHLTKNVFEKIGPKTEEHIPSQYLNSSDLPFS